MEKIYTELTDMLDIIQQDEFGEWIVDHENDGTPEHPIQMPYVSYSGIVKKFMDAVYTFDKIHPEYGLNRYGDILERNGIKWGSDSMGAVDVAGKDGICVMALLLGAVRGWGIAWLFQKGGSIQRWLERLKEIDMGSTEKSS